MTDETPLDAAADGAFSGKLADPADTLTKRGGKGIVVYEGQEYDRLAWTRRCAALGYTLAAGEGAILNAALVEVEQERDALRKSVLDLLAVVHGDGGHHTGSVGLQQSFADAERSFYALRTEVQRLRALVERAFQEGQDGRILDGHEQFIYDVAWEHSDAFKALAVQP